MKNRSSEIVLQGQISHDEFCQAIERLPEGGTLCLKQAIVRLHEPVTISKSLHIEGDNCDSSWIVGKALPFGLLFQGAGPWSLRHFSVAQCGVKVEDGQLDAEGCRFAHNAQGVGIQIEGNTRGRLAQCQAVGNDQGIVLAGRCDLLISENRCLENRDGIVFQDQARGAALKNDCQGNSGHGIWVTALARPVLDADFREELPKPKRPEPNPEPEEEDEDEDEDEDAFEQLLGKGLEDGAVTLEDIQEAFEGYGLTPDVFDLLVERLADEGIEVVNEDEG